MSPSHWALLTIDQILTDDGYEIVITTDIACHLYMRWTTIIPKEHLIPILKRGLYLHSDKYFCFNCYEDNEQEEAGDTTTHTFIKEPWPKCETRYFYFHGTINTGVCPSTSPIFEKHRPYLADWQLLADVNYLGCNWTNAWGQTFQPDHDYLASELWLMLNQTELHGQGEYITKLTLIGGSCWTETILWSALRQSTALPPKDTKEWEKFNLPNIALKTGIDYRIVVHNTANWYKWDGTQWVLTPHVAAINWWASTVDYSYPRGRYCYGCNFKDSSGAWILSPKDSRTFAIIEKPA